MKDWFDWLTKEENREAVLAMIVAGTAFFGGLGWLYDRFTAKSAAPGPTGPSAPVNAGRDVGAVQHQQGAAGAITVQAAPGAVVTIGYTIEQHEERLARREAELRAELTRAHDADRALLLAEIEEVRRQAADAEASFEARRAKLAQASALLDDLAEGLPQTRLDAARQALAAGDDRAADAIFAEVEAMEAAAVSRAADAAFARGRIADADIRWSDAADHYARAARLAPSYDHLRAARAATWRAGDYAAAFRFGEDLLAIARVESGDEAEAYATALNEHALTLKAVGRFAEAEPLYRQALAIDEKTWGTEHPAYAVHLNNLALLLWATGRPAEAEPLYWQALAITEKTLGIGHPAYATRLNNLAGLLQETGRPAEAEPLYRQALAIDEKTLGTKHPDYARDLNNLAGLLRETGRPAEAEPLYRQALAILVTVYGEDHPSTRIVAANLAALGRDEADGVVGTPP